MRVSGAQLSLSGRETGRGISTLQSGKGPLEGECLWPVQKDLFCSESVGVPILSLFLAVLSTDSAGC